MTANDIITLANAGFNANQIAKILEIANAPAPVPTPPAQPAPLPAPVPVQSAPVPAQPAPANAPDYILDAIGKIDARLNQMAIQNSRMPERQTTDDILAEIINPPREGDKK